MLSNYENKMLGGNRFFLIASGPSLTQDQVDHVRGKGKVLVINDNYLLAPWADYLYFCDETWFNWHKDRKEFKEFKGKKYSQTESWRDNKEAIACGTTFIASEHKDGLSTNPDKIYQGSNSGYQAINLAYHLGAREIILIGYDMQFTQGKAHWFGDHPNNVKSNYNTWMRFYERLAKDAKKLGLKIINCTKETALTCFPREDLNGIC